MADTGVKYPATVSTLSDGIYNDEDWTAPNNVKVNDGNNAGAESIYFDTGDYFYVLKASNYSAGVPAGATIDGIKVEIEHRAPYATVYEALVQLSKDNSARVGDNYSLGRTIPTAYAVWTYGGAAGLWNTTWTAAEVNAATFALHLSYLSGGSNAVLRVDFVRITVYYTEVVAGSTARSRVVFFG